MYALAASRLGPGRVVDRDGKVNYRHARPGLLGGGRDSSRRSSTPRRCLWSLLDGFGLFDACHRKMCFLPLADCRKPKWESFTACRPYRLPLTVPCRVGIRMIRLCCVVVAVPAAKCRRPGEEIIGHAPLPIKFPCVRVIHNGIKTCM